MSVEYESRRVIESLIESAEATTGESYTNLTEAHQALKKGYGQGGFPYIDTSKMTSFEYFHNEGKNVELINKWDTSNATIFMYMFNNCPLDGYVIDINTSQAENCEYMFYGQYNTTDVQLKNKLDMSNCTNCGHIFFNRPITEFPLENTGKVTMFREAFHGCRFTEAELDLTSCTDIRNGFNNCSLLVTLTLRNTQNLPSSYWASCFTGCLALTNLSVDALNIVSNTLDFSACKNLTVESLVNILNALSDNTGVSTTYTVKLGATNLAKLSDEQKQIATNKNISLT